MRWAKVIKSWASKSDANSRERGAKLTPEILKTLSQYFPAEKGVIPVIGVTELNKSNEIQTDTEMTAGVTPENQASPDCHHRKVL